MFGPTPRHYTVKVNRKARRAALRSVLSLHAERESLAVFDATKFEGPSTSQAAELLEEWGATSPTLVVLTDVGSRCGKSFRNLSHAHALPVQDAGVARSRRGGLPARVRGRLESLVARAAGSASGGEEEEEAA